LKEKYQYKEQFDLVTNNGTGEHIFDQRVVFENMHNLCKVGGIMLCVLPFAPWINHGFYNFNPNVFRDIVAANGYHFELMWLAQNSGAYIEVPSEIDSWSFYEQKKPLNPPSILEQAYLKLHNLQNMPTNISIVAAYKKVHDQTFQIPMQGRYVNDLDESLRDSYSESNKDVRQGDHTSAKY
jgi:SAM-dependent methyltransferase